MVTLDVVKKRVNVDAEEIFKKNSSNSLLILLRAKFAKDSVRCRRKMSSLLCSFLYEVFYINVMRTVNFLFLEKIWKMHWNATKNSDIILYKLRTLDRLLIENESNHISDILNFMSKNCPLKLFLQTQ